MLISIKQLLSALCYLFSTRLTELTEFALCINDALV